jgi:hypothetical protein
MEQFDNFSTLNKLEASVATTPRWVIRFTSKLQGR